MKQSYLAIIAYDGTHYLGWQKTRMGKSVQQTLEEAIAKITGERETPEAASRTDRGVHAEGQTISFSLKKDWDPFRLIHALNAHLPKDIRIRSLKKISPDFHPTLDAIEKEYHYRLSLNPFQKPTHRLYAWHFYKTLNVDGMKQAASSLIGKHDFSAFANEKDKDPICCISSIEIQSLEEERLQIAIRGDRFLYKMARNIVGTLVYVGCGKIPSDYIPSLLASKDRKKGGISAPAHGLFLHRVLYCDFSKSVKMPRRRPDFESGVADVEADKLGKFSDADGLKSGRCLTSADSYLLSGSSTYSEAL